MAPLSACDLTVELELPPGRPFWTNGDALRGQVLLELAVPADRLGDNSVDQVRIDGEVKVAYGWDATQAGTSKDAELAAKHCSPRLTEILAEGTIHLKVNLDKPGTFNARWPFEFILPAGAGSGLQTSTVPEETEAAKAKEKVKALLAAAEISGPASFDDGVLTLAHAVVATADVKLVLPGGRSFFGRKFASSHPIGAEAHKEVVFRITPSAVVLSPTEAPKPFRQTLDVELSKRLDAKPGRLAVVITPPPLPIPTGAEFVPVKVGLAYVHPLHMDGPRGIWKRKGKEPEEPPEERLARERFLIGSLEGAIHVWTAGRERLVILSFEPIQLNIFSDDPQLTAIEGLELPMRLRYKGSWPPDACGIETGSFRTSAGDRTFDLVLQLVFSPELPCVPPIVTLCKGVLELPFVAPFHPRPADAVRPTEDERSPTTTDARGRSSSLLSMTRPLPATTPMVRPAMTARARSGGGASEKWTLPIDKELPPVPSQNSSRAEASPSGGGSGGEDAGPTDFAIVAAKYDIARAAVQNPGLPGGAAPRPEVEEEEAPPAYDGRRA